MKFSRSQQGYVLGAVGSLGLITLINAASHEYREISIVNYTQYPVEVGFYHKSGRNSAQTFQSSGSIPANTTAKKTVRLNGPMTARVLGGTGTSTQFTVSANDKEIRLSGNDRLLMVANIKGS